jgi:hypothetical protein
MWAAVRAARGKALFFRRFSNRPTEHKKHYRTFGRADFVAKSCLIVVSAGRQTDALLVDGKTRNRPLKAIDPLGGDLGADDRQTFQVFHRPEVLQAGVGDPGPG